MHLLNLLHDGFDLLIIFDQCISDYNHRNLHGTKKDDFHRLISGAKEDRTPDPLLAKQVLSQLSYNPKCLVSIALIISFEKRFRTHFFQNQDS